MYSDFFYEQQLVLPHVLMGEMLGGVGFEGAWPEMGGGRREASGCWACALGSVSFHFDLPAFHCFLLIRFTSLLSYFLKCFFDNYNNNIRSLQLVE